MTALLLTIVASVLSILGTALLAYAAILGKQLAPDSAENIRHLVSTLEPMIKSQRDLFQAISDELNNSAQLASKMPTRIAVHNQMAAEHTAKAYKVIEEALNIGKASETAGKVRYNIVVGSVVLAAAVSVSAYSSWVAYKDQQKNDAESKERVVVQEKSH